MRMISSSIVASAVLLLLTACVTPAPGADKVRITKNSSDVSTCTAVGNIKVPTDSHGNVDMANAATQFRNQTIGLGGNTGLVTYGLASAPAQGVAYRCPQ
jgi:hypothetical protein